MLLKILKYGQVLCAVLLAAAVPRAPRALYSSIVKNEAADFDIRSNESQEHLLHGAVTGNNDVWHTSGWAEDANILIEVTVHVVFVARLAGTLRIHLST